MKKFNSLRCSMVNNLQTSTLIKNSWFSRTFPILLLALTLGINTAAAADTPPSITCPGNITVSCIGDVPACNPDNASAATGTCGAVSISCSQGPLEGGACGGTIIEIYTATDECFNSASCARTITVNDETPPVPHVPPADVTADCMGDIPPAIDLTGTDNCDGNITVRPKDDNTPPYDCNQTITIIRTWTFTDKCGNSSSVSQTIIVNDNTAPTITCKPDKPALCNEPIIFDDPTVSDNCHAEPTVTFGTVYDLDVCGNGTVTRTWTATDDCNNSSSCSQEITINDCGDFELLKLTNGAVDPSRDWSLTLSYGEVAITESTFGDANGRLFENVGPLSASETYTICETNIMAGWSAVWKIDTDADGIAESIVPPVNPDYPQDLGTRCFQFGADTYYPLPISEPNISCKLLIEVDNTFPGGGPRTPGYWKNWASCSGGGNQIETAAKNGGCDEGFCTLDDLLNDPGIVWCAETDDEFVISDCEDAVNTLDQRDIVSGKKKANDAAYTLAMSLLAAQLNFAAGAEVCDAAQTAALAAEVLLCDLGFDGTGNYLRPKDDEYTQALELAAALDSYNNGQLCDNGNGSSLMSPGVGDIPAETFELREPAIKVYPNPSNTDVTIEFTLPDDTKAILDIYDLTGKRVQRLFEQEVEAGLKYTAKIIGNRLPNGTYIYRLIAGKDSFQGKVLLFD